MHRREFLAWGVGTIGVGITGCFGRAFTSTDPSVTGEELTLHPRERATITITAHHVQRLSFGVPSTAHDLLNPRSFSVTPEPTTVAESLPPIWQWDRSRTTVEASFTVTVADTAEPTELSYRVTLSNGETELTETYPIAITLP